MILTFGTIASSLSSFSPLDIAGCRLWLKADSLALTDGATVSVWADSSSAGTSTSVIGTPIFKSSIINGNPVVRFNGSSNYLLTQPSITGTTSSVFAVLVRRVLSSSPNSGFLSAVHDAATDDYNGVANFDVSDFGGGDWIVFRDLANRSTVPFTANDVPWAFGAVFDGTYETTYKNGIAGTPVASTGSFDFHQVYLACRHYSGGPLLYGAEYDLAEFVLYDSAIVGSDLSNMNTYLAIKYGI